VNSINKLLAVLPVVLMLTLAPVMAQTTVDLQWDGSGHFQTNFNPDDDAQVVFETSGSSISGEFHGIDYNDNPYNYGVDTVDVKIKSNFENGFVGYAFTRTDSYDRMYGPSGQTSYTFIQADEGSFAWHSKSNFASLRNCNYGWQNDNQITARGDYIVDHELIVDSNKYAYIYEEGNGETQISDMSEEAGKGFTFGKGCGCYTNTKVKSTGSGEFTLYAKAPNKIETDSGITVEGGDLTIYSSFNNGFTINNFALSGS